MPIAADLASRLAKHAEAVCRYYLSAGVRAGNYWIVGDLMNSKGRSLYVHLAGPRVGKWTDAATGQHGDLLDLVRETRGLGDFHAAADEARRFLCLPQPEAGPRREHDAAVRPACERARRLFAMARSLADTAADAYLRRRGIVGASTHEALRFHPSCFYRDFVTGRTATLPAMIAAVTDGAGEITGVHRTYLAVSGPNPASVGKARVDSPRRALGGLLGNAVRFRMPVAGSVRVIAAGEGLETMLSLSDAMPAMPMAAALTANHLAAFSPPSGCLRLYIAGDADQAGRHGIEGLSSRVQVLGILPLVIAPVLGDFNEDLRQLGPNRLRAHLRTQLVPEDAGTFLPTS